MATLVLAALFESRVEEREICRLRAALLLGGTVEELRPGGESLRRGRRADRLAPNRISLDESGSLRARYVALFIGH